MLADIYAVMYNEELLLPYWLRHYETFADRIFVWDDASTDGTREILESHPLVTVLPTTTHGANQEYWIGTLFPQYEQYSRGKADWVFFADADEFIYHPDMVEFLERKKHEGVQLIWCRGFAMISQGLPRGKGQIYDEIQMGLPDKLESKWTVFDPALTLRFRKGRHGGPKYVDDGTVTDCTGEIKLLHYRYLGEKFFEQRDMVNAERFELAYHEGIVYERNKIRRLPNKRRGVALDWYACNRDKAFNVLDGP